MKHNLKLREEFADAVYNGEKTFEIRIKDTELQKVINAKLDRLRKRVADDTDQL